MRTDFDWTSNGVESSRRTRRDSHRVGKRNDVRVTVSHVPEDGEMGRGSQSVTGVVTTQMTVFYGGSSKESCLMDRCHVVSTKD